MIYQFVILMEFIGALFLLGGIIPFKRTGPEENLPLVNKIVFLTLASLVFFSLAATSVQYEYPHCYVSEEVESGDTTTYTGVCDFPYVEDQSLSAFNYGFGIVSSLLLLVTMLIAGFSQNDYKYGDD